MFKIGDTVKVTGEGFVRYGQSGLVVFVKSSDKTIFSNVVEFASGYGDYKNDDLQYVETRTMDEILDDRYRHECRETIPLEQAIADEI
jgi:hypothetical protein